MQRFIVFSLIAFCSQISAALAFQHSRLGNESDLRTFEMTVKKSDALIVGSSVEPYQLSPGINIMDNSLEHKQLPNHHWQNTWFIDCMNVSGHPMKITLLMPVSDIDNPKIEFSVNDKFFPSVCFLNKLGKSASAIMQSRYKNAYCNDGSQLFSYLGAIKPYEHKSIKIVYQPTKSALPQACRLVLGYSDCVKNIDESSRLIARGVQTAEIYVKRGKALSEIGEYELAIADFNKAIELDNQSILAYRERANVYSLLGKTDLAVNDSKMASKLNMQINQSNQ